MGNETKEQKVAAANSAFADDVAKFFSREAVEIDPGKVHPIREDDPRIDHTKDPTMKAEYENLRENIKANGQFEPGLVYPMPDGNFVVIAGLQRLKAVRELRRDGKPGIKYLARVADPKLADLNQLVVACATNAARVAQTPMQEAYWIVQLLQAFKGSQSEVARRIGVDEKKVRDARMLVECSTPSMQKAVEIGALKPTTAVNIIRETKSDEKKQVQKAEEAIKRFETQDVVKSKGQKGPKKKAISGSEIEGSKPSAAKIKRIIAAKGTPAQIGNVLQWVVGEISTEALKTSSPWFVKVDAELLAEDKKKEEEAMAKTKQKEEEAKARNEAKMKRDLEKQKKKEEEAKLSPVERKRRKLEAELEKLKNEGKTASSTKTPTKGKK